MLVLGLGWFQPNCHRDRPSVMTSPSFFGVLPAFQRQNPLPPLLIRGSVVLLGSSVWFILDNPPISHLIWVRWCQWRSVAHPILPSAQIHSRLSGNPSPETSVLQLPLKNTLFEPHTLKDAQLLVYNSVRTKTYRGRGSFLPKSNFQAAFAFGIKRNSLLFGLFMCSIFRTGWNGCCVSNLYHGNEFELMWIMFCFLGKCWIHYSVPRADVSGF